MGVGNQTQIMAAKPRKHIGVRVNDYRTDVRRGLRRAGEQAFAAVEIGVDRAEVAPEHLSDSGRRHLTRLISQTGMSFASLAHDSAGAGLADARRADEQIARAVQTLRMAADMHVRVVSHDVGELLNLSASERDRALEALRTLATEAERVGAIYAVRSRLCAPADLAELVRTIDCPLVRISIDPAAMLMAGFDPADAITAYGDQVSLAYVRDAVRGAPNRAGSETALGEGALDLPAYLAALSVSGCSSPPILRRTQAADPVASLAADKSALENTMP